MIGVSARFGDSEGDGSLEEYVGRGGSSGSTGSIANALDNFEIAEGLSSRASHGTDAFRSPRRSLSQRRSLENASEDESSASAYIASLGTISGIYNDLQRERDLMVQDAERVYKERISSVSRLRKLETKLMDLSQEKLSLEERLEALGLKDEELREKILNLDKKVLSFLNVETVNSPTTTTPILNVKKAEEICTESQKFEFAIREMRGESTSSNAVESGGETASTVPSNHSSSSCLRTLFGHSGQVLCVDACPESRVVISGSADKSLRTWDMDTGRRQDALYGHNGWVHCVRLQEHKAVTGSGDKTIKIWDILPATDNIGYGVGVGGPCQATFVGHDAGVTCVDFDSSHVLSGSMDRTIRRWNLEHHNDEVFELIGHDGAVSCLQFWSYALVTGSVDKSIRMWDLRTGKSHRTLRGHAGPVRSLQFDDRIIISGGLDRQALVWDIRTGKVIQCIETPGQVLGLCFSRGECLVASSDKVIYVYDVSSGKVLTEKHGHSGAVLCVVQAEDKAVSGSTDHTCRLWI
ncbi:hypothetical protein NDN08_000354 [Rhodosorus marinus]|uniref:Autophagy-related protein 16 domain-containing protein n=1 Tax=Rhodosorus marinus TaxID=101924 RepID=A0AAV8UTA1_9RHOD|nr:hypothetical protein NDN08_000354 [Rhodosorus marinus]